jgi:uncharacterized protein involved in outer membrane biogenesis
LILTRIDADLSFRALLKRQLIIKSIVLSDPIIQLISGPDGSWNFENPQAEVSPNTFRLGTISRIEIKRRQLTGSNLLPADMQGHVFFKSRRSSQ